MFERKNRSVLTDHYTKLIDQDDLVALQSDERDASDGFMTVKRVDHGLGDGQPVLQLLDQDLSKRKLKMGQSKKAMLKYHGNPHKTVFDEEGEGHAVYEFKGPTNDDHEMLEAARKFAEGEREKLAKADVLDREVARDKRRERKRKRKDREVRLPDTWAYRVLTLFQRGEMGLTPLEAPAVDTDDDELEIGYVSPAFDLPPTDDEADFIPGKPWGPLPPKRARLHEETTDRTKGRTLEDDEQLALQLLHGT